MEFDLERTGAAIDSFDSGALSLGLEHSESDQRFHRLRHRTITIGQLRADLLRLLRIACVRDALVAAGSFGNLQQRVL